MTLKEKFDKLVRYDENGIESEMCEVIADDFAIGFTEWIEKYQGGVPNLKVLKELLEIYKKEKGL